jgi:hypothetical protein
MNAQVKQLPPIEPQPAYVPKLTSLEELSATWAIPLEFLQRSCRSRCADPLPTFKIGRWHRVDLSDPRLAEWLERRRRNIGGRNDR